jgi:D-alanyl-D-alanine carboxypeptidase (penicillin-binding protein 5/6)
MNFQSFKIYSKNQAVLTPVVWKGSRDEVRLGFNRDIYVSLPGGSTANLKSIVQRTDPLIAPIPQYRQVGTLKVLADGKVISELPLQALDQVNEATIFGRAFDSLRLMLPR